MQMCLAECTLLLHLNKYVDIDINILIDMGTDTDVHGQLTSSIWCKTHFSRQLIADHSDVVGALPVGAAPTTSSLST